MVDDTAAVFAKLGPGALTAHIVESSRLEAEEVSGLFDREEGGGGLLAHSITVARTREAHECGGGRCTCAVTD